MIKDILQMFRKFMATGAALGIVGLASYVAAGLMNIISGSNFFPASDTELWQKTTGDII